MLYINILGRARRTFYDAWHRNVATYLRRPLSCTEWWLSPERPVHGDLG
jgi:hypothetical protein